jgi:colanic acid biosynthesis glycosyl transferase WcaI
LVADFAGHAFGMDLSLALARRGHIVEHTYCSTNLTPQGDLRSREGVEVHPISSGGTFDKYRLGRRLVSELVYGARTSTLIWRRRPDAVLTSNMPLVSLALIAGASRLVRARWVLWLQDVQTGLIEQSLSGPARILARALRWLERWLIRVATEVVIISDDFADEVEQAGRSDFTTIRNWAVLTDLPEHPKDNSWGQEHGFDESRRPLFLYSGTLGRKHPPELLVALAEELRHLGGVAVISEGDGADRLREQVESLGLQNVTVLPFQPHARLAEVLASGDVLVAVLDGSAGTYSVPSKILSYLCAGRPVLAAMPSENGAARMIQHEARAGVVVEPTEAGMRTGTRRLLAQSDSWFEIGRAARQFAETDFDVDLKAKEFEALLCGEDLASRTSDTSGTCLT